MKARCHDEQSPSFKYYGGRGITVCSAWCESFLIFRDWALRNGWHLSLELDRIDVNGNYCPENCRWATRAQQMANTRKKADAKTSK